MNFRNLRTLIYKERIVLTRYPARILSNAIFPMFLVLIFAFTSLLFIDTSDHEAVSNFANRIFAGMIVYIFLNAGSDVATSVIEEQQQGTIESIYLTPVPKYYNILAIIVIKFAFVTITIIPYFYIMSVVLDEIEINNPEIVLLFAICAIIQSASIGIFFAGFTLRAKDTAARISFFFTFLFMIFAGIFVPFEGLGDRFILISYLLPLSYAMDGLSASLSDNDPYFMPVALELGLSVILSFVSYYLATIFFNKMESSLRKEGKLVDY